MRKTLIPFLFTFLATTILSSCYYDVEEELYPSNTPCDTISASYINDVVPILQQNCYTCHAAPASLGSGIVLDSYDQLKNYADNGQLADAINHTGSVTPMPKDLPPLNNCNRAMINRWILNHSPNN